MSRYDLVSHWHVEAPIERVFQVVHAVEGWPRWWPQVRQVVLLERGDADGVGDVHRVIWGTTVPYQLTLTVKRMVVQRPWRLDLLLEGDLHGNGRWLLREQGGATVIQHDWHVATTRTWMNVMSPVLGPMFRWNHGILMADGARGLARLLAQD